MDEMTSLLLSIALLALLCVPAFVGLLRWMRSKRYAPAGAENLPAKCQSCGSRSGCSSQQSNKSADNAAEDLTALAADSVELYAAQDEQGEQDGSDRQSNASIGECPAITQVLARFPQAPC